jgi:hypothetical protein
LRPPRPRFPASLRPCVPLRLQIGLAWTPRWRVSRIKFCERSLGATQGQPIGKHTEKYKTISFLSNASEQIICLPDLLKLRACEWDGWRFLHNIARASISLSFDSLAYNDDFMVHSLQAKCSIMSYNPNTLLQFRLFIFSVIIR